MSAVVIENPVLNSPYDEPRRHFGFDDQGITSDIIEGRRRSSYFVPVPASKRSSGQLALAAEWTQDRLEENDFVNRVRGRVVRWRNGGYVHVTPTTRRLLDYWQSPDRERKFFFCQIEAAETAIYLAESAFGTGDQWIENELRKHADEWNEGLYRIAFKMATGSGKTVLMAMLIAWQTLNKRAAPRDNRFTDAFLVVTPGITIRDRLRVLLPSDPGNYYAERDIVPPDLVERLGQAKIHVVNFHKFLPRKTSDAGKTAPANHRGRRDTRGRRARRDRGAGGEAPASRPRPRDEAADHRLQRRGAPLLPGARGGQERTADRRRAPRGQGAQQASPYLAQRPAVRCSANSASRSSTTSRRRRSSCAAPATTRARCSPGWCRISR